MVLLKIYVSHSIVQCPSVNSYLYFERLRGHEIQKSGCTWMMKALWFCKTSVAVGHSSQHYVAEHLNLLLVGLFFKHCSPSCMCHIQLNAADFEEWVVEAALMVLCKSLSWCRDRTDWMKMHHWNEVWFKMWIWNVVQQSLSWRVFSLIYRQTDTRYWCRQTVCSGRTAEEAEGAGSPSAHLLSDDTHDWLAGGEF